MLAGFGDLKQRADMFIDLDTDPRVDPPARGTERATLATLDPWRGAVSLRWVVVHMVEEYARHNGHADLLRERIDGRLGQ
jgi:hypothetical protein